MSRPKKPICHFCGKKFHPKGILAHERHCLSRPTDTIAPRPATVEIPSHVVNTLHAILDSIWSQLSFDDKIEALDPRDPSNPDGL